MQVRFFASLRAIVGAKCVDLKVPDAITAQELLAAILRRYPELAPEILDESGGLSRRVQLMVNGRSVVYLEEGLATRLEGDEAIDLFPAVAGGC